MIAKILFLIVGAAVGQEGTPPRANAPIMREGVYGAGYLGYSWSSFTGSAVGCILLNFGVEWLHTSSAGNRDYGFQLRCLSE
ncbi:hypothetical protein [uncultured Rikenella sp.]|uniref:hypothetical protein n=1 Tax=uncultured Rikenella sp. TaxID=368003 RepID=UPI002632A241|nr:hypothetical protein [uncultured Rikenella sp.]